LDWGWSSTFTFEIDSCKQHLLDENRVPSQTIRHNQIAMLSSASTRSFIISSCLFAYLSLQQKAHGFLAIHSPTRPASFRTTPSQLFLEKWIAEMIDGELYRQGHKEDYEREWMVKNREAVVQHVDPSSNYLMLDDDDLANLRQRRKDEVLAKNDPQRYCADRCIATGNCEVFEDLYVVST
jgi:hypothetical protein